MYPGESRQKYLPYSNQIRCIRKAGYGGKPFDRKSRMIYNLSSMVYRIKGRVLKGRKEGKRLGYPTANIKTKENIPQGIYVSTTKLNDKEYESVSFFGNAVTFGEKQVLLETFILDFFDDIYDKEIEVTLLEKIRDNKKFDTALDLVKQIRDDVLAAREYFKNNV